MKDKRIKELENELRYLTSEELKKEVDSNIANLNNKDVNIKDLAKDIYLKRGIDYDKLNMGFLNKWIDSINEMFSLFKNKDKKTKNKMIVECIYIIVLLVLLKIPFDLVRDIGYDYIELLSTNNILFKVWNLAFLLIYTITIICTSLVLIRNFNNKYNN